MIDCKDPRHWPRFVKDFENVGAHYVCPACGYTFTWAAPRPFTPITAGPTGSQA